MIFTIVKGSNCYGHVRVEKFIKYFEGIGARINPICWLRVRETANSKETYLLTGGGHGGKVLAFYYPLWILFLFFYFIRYKQTKNEVLLIVDFDSALPIYLASKFNSSLKYLYDIHDEFAIRYKMPQIMKHILRAIDKKIRNKACLTIHVDESRVSNIDDNYSIIYNSPEDFYEPIKKNNSEKLYCVTGLLNKGRGAESLYEFAKTTGARFIVAGEAIDNDAKAFLSLSNVKFLGYLPQKELFSYISNCSAIFSLYDPSVEINRLAASNKLYDAMMLGVPVITNNGLLMSKFVEENSIGFNLSFCFDESWLAFHEIPNKELNKAGCRGRKIYLDKFSYQANFSSKLDNIILNYFKES